MKDHKIKEILNHLQDQRGFDFSGYRTSMLERRLQKRVFSTSSKNAEEYLRYLQNSPDELDNLIDVFTINVSRFFRNSIAFESINKIILPELLLEKSKKQESDLRIWSAGCSFGEEPYSIAILLNELLKKEDFATIKPTIFATDLDKKALIRAHMGIYNFDSIKNVKYGILKKYFTIEDEKFILSPEIKKMVHFSFHDLLNKNRHTPPDSIFGGFDIVICRNVLIYFEPEYQKYIFEKLYRSLNKGGYLILGEAEVPLAQIKGSYRRVNNCCKIYRKIG